MKIINMLLVLVILFLSGCIVEKPIGGERDEHGCLGPAGYSWDENIGACIREWELDEDQREAAKIAVAPMSIRPITVVEVLTARCPGCFSVKIQPEEGYETTTITLENWEIKETEEITNFEECAAAGNPVMESYPRQCRAGDEIFVEEILCTADVGTCPDGSYVSRKPPTCEFEACPDGAMAREDAVRFAQDSECTAEGGLIEEYFYNENSRTWWIELDIEKEGCNPACVVSEDGSAEINWRCTGLIPE